MVHLLSIWEGAKSAYWTSETIDSTMPNEKEQAVASSNASEETRVTIPRAKALALTIGCTLEGTGVLPGIAGTKTRVRPLFMPRLRHSDAPTCEPLVAIHRGARQLWKLVFNSLGCGASSSQYLLVWLCHCIFF